MKFRALADAFRALDQSRSRHEAVDTLAGLFRRTPTAVLGTIVYLSQGKIAPDFAGVELGVAEKLALRATAAAEADEEAVRELARGSGDLGAAAELLLLGRRRGATARLRSPPSPRVCARLRPRRGGARRPANWTPSAGCWSRRRRKRRATSSGS